MRWAGHVARKRDMRNAHGMLIRERMSHGIVGRLMFKPVSKKWSLKDCDWTLLALNRDCEHGNEPSSFTIC